MIQTTVLILLGLLGAGIPVAAALGVLGLTLGEIYGRFPLHLAMGELAWSTSNSFLLVAVPFFVLLGEILLRSGTAERMRTIEAMSSSEKAMPATAAARGVRSRARICSSRLLITGALPEPGIRAGL